MIFDVKRLLYLTVGFVSLFLGIIGAFLPIMPTVPFLLVAVFCFSRSSKKLHSWLVSHPVWGGYIRLNRGLNRTTKIKIVVLLWLSLSVSIFFTFRYIPVLILLILIGVLITLYILKK